MTRVQRGQRVIRRCCLAAELSPGQQSHKAHAIPPCEQTSPCRHCPSPSTTGSVAGEQRRLMMLSPSHRELPTAAIPTVLKAQVLNLTTPSILPTTLDFLLCGQFCIATTVNQSRSSYPTPALKPH